MLRKKRYLTPDITADRLGISAPVAFELSDFNNDDGEFELEDDN